MAFYKGIDDAPKQPAYVATKAPLQIYRTDDFERDGRELLRRGYAVIGSSIFNAAASDVSEYQLREQAGRVGAHVVLVMSKYSHTVSGALPLTVPTTSTTYSTGQATAYGSGGTVQAYGSGTSTTYGTQTMMMPYSIARSDYIAVYFVRVFQRVGLYGKPLDDETRRRLERNSGLMVDFVVDESPAYAADVLPGDVLLDVAGEPVYSDQSYLELITKHEGQAVPFRFERNGKTVIKKILIRSYPALSPPDAEVKGSQ